MDNGFHTITTINENKGWLLENLIAIKLKQTSKELFYWQNKVEIDFVSDGKAIQVTSSEQIPVRETKAFEQFSKKNKKIKKFVLISPKKKGKEKMIEYLTIKEFLET